jgi:hypothetical protein
MAEGKGSQHRPAAAEGSGPAAVAPGRLLPGQTGQPVTMTPAAVGASALAAAAAAAGITMVNGIPSAPGVLWADGTSRLFVLLSKLQVRLAAGAIAVSVPVICDEAGGTEVAVSFAVGRPDRPLGMTAAAEGRPRGPRTVVDVWGEAITALAWQVVLDVAAGAAATAGPDASGAPLIPVSITSTSDGLTVLPQARFAFDKARSVTRLAAGSAP